MIHDPRVDSQEILGGNRERTRDALVLHIQDHGTAFWNVACFMMRKQEEVSPLLHASHEGDPVPSKITSAGKDSGADSQPIARWKKGHHIREVDTHKCAHENAEALDHHNNGRRERE